MSHSAFSGRSRLWVIGPLLVFVWLLPGSAGAQVADSSEGWVPLGPAPATQTGGGSRGYVLPMEDSGVTTAGKSQFSIHGVAANYFYLEEKNDYLVSQRYEVHTIALDYRRGFKIGAVQPFEIGGRAQIHERDGGMLNGFIAGVEALWHSLGNRESTKAQLRSGGTRALPLGTVIMKNGSPLYHDIGSASGLGDISVFAKLSLLGSDPAKTGPQLSVRAAANVRGGSSFTEGAFLGLGVSLDKKLLSWLAFHGDVRATRVMDRRSAFHLPLRRVAYGFSAGAEIKLTRNNSLSTQIDGSSTPYPHTGTAAFDSAYGGLTIGVGHRFKVSGRQMVAHAYGRENLHLPFQLRWNLEPDFSLGLKLTIQP